MAAGRVGSADGGEAVLIAGDWIVITLLKVARDRGGATQHRRPWAQLGRRRGRINGIHYCSHERRAKTFALHLCVYKYLVLHLRLAVERRCTLEVGYY